MNIRTVTITVPNPDETLAWFQDTLGQMVSENSIQIGSSVIGLEQGEVDPDAYIHLAFDIPENQVEQGAEWLRARGVSILPGDDGDIQIGGDTFASHSIYFNAPGNLNLELIARHRLANATEADFAPASLLSVSEVGIASENVMADNAAAVEALGQSAFGEPTDAFAPVGNDRGLLIIANAAYPWLPTDDQMRRNPISVDVEAPQSAEFEISGVQVTSTAY